MKKILQAFLFLFALLASTQAWGGTYYGRLSLTASPTAGGDVAASTTKSTPSSYSDTSSVDNSGRTMFGKSKSLTFYAYAQVADGYEFTGWSSSAGGTIVSTDNPYTVTVTAKSSSSRSPTTTTLYANFKANVTYTYYAKLNVTASDSNMGTVAASTTTTAGTYGSTATATGNSGTVSTSSASVTLYAFAQANAAYDFLGWADTASGTILSTDTRYAVTVTTSATDSSNPAVKQVYARFAAKKTFYGRLSLTAVNSAAGSVSASATTTAGDYGATSMATAGSALVSSTATEASVTLYAHAQASGIYQFGGWSTTADGAIVSSANPYTVTITSTSTSSTSPTTTELYAQFVTACCRVNGTTYLTLAEGVAAAGTTYTLEILQDVRLTADITTVTAISVPADCSPTIDLNGHTITAPITSAGATTITDTTVTHEGSVSGALAATGDGMFTIVWGVYNTDPTDWTDAGSLCVANYDGTYTVAVPSNTSGITGCTIDARRGVRVVEDPADDVLPFTYASSNWVYQVSTNPAARAWVAVAAAWPQEGKSAAIETYNDDTKTTWHQGLTDGVARMGDKSYDYNSGNLNITNDTQWATLVDTYGESTVVWQKNCYGLIEAIHTNASGVIRAWFKFPEYRFDAIQRDNDTAQKEHYWSDQPQNPDGRWEILLSEETLKKRFGWDRVTGTDEDLMKIRLQIDTFEPNGLRLWENAVLDLDPTNQLLTTVTQSANGELALDVPGPGKDPQYGYDVQYVLRRVTNYWEQASVTNQYYSRKKNWTEVSARGSSPQIPIPLRADDKANAWNASGLYRIWTLIIPNTAEAITNEIPTTNIIGVLKVVSPCTNTITAVPWRHLTTDPTQASDVTVSEVVNHSNLTAGDRLYYYDNETGKYYGYLLKAAADGSLAWDGMLNVTQDGVTTTDATRDTLPRGGAIWTARANPNVTSGTYAGKVDPYFVCGQHEYGAYTNAVKAGTYAAPASTPIANPTPADVNLNDITFVGTIGSTDTIVVPSVNPRVHTVYVRKNNQWGYNKKTYKNGRLYSSFVTNAVIPAGTGFWYERRSSGELKIVWPTWRED